MSRPYIHKAIGAGLSVLAIAVSAHAAGPRSATEFAALGKYALRTARGRDDLPQHLSTDRERNARIGTELRDLLRAGVRQAGEDARQNRPIYTVVSDSEIKATPAAERPYEAKLVARVHQDTKHERFKAGPELNDSENFSSSAFYFYRQFFAAYAGLEKGFRKADSPLARGVAALAAYHNTYRGNLCLLPDFKPEAALALLLLNADPQLPEVMRTSAPDAKSLRARVAGALDRTGFANAADKAARLLGDPVPGTPAKALDLAGFVGDDTSHREKVWQAAQSHIPHPGLLAELGIAAWKTRDVTPSQKEALDRVFGSMLDTLERDIAGRGIRKDEITSKAVFDISQLTGLFGFVWTYHPDFVAWRKQAVAIAGEKDPRQRNTGRIELQNRLKDMLTGPADRVSEPAARFCRLVANVPLKPGLSQPDIRLEYVERTARRSGKSRKVRYVSAARLVLAWELQRTLRRDAEIERVVFVGAAGEHVEEDGLPDETTETKPTVEDPQGPTTAAGKDMDRKGTEEGKEGGRTGEGSGKHGDDDEGEEPAAKPPELVESRGFAADTPVLWRERDGDAPGQRRPLEEAVRGGFGATLIRDASKPRGAGAVELAKVWSEFAAAAIEKNGKAIRFELDNGAKLVVGSAQELAIKPDARGDIGFKQARAIQIDEELLGEDGKPVRVTGREELKEPTPLTVVSMAVYENLIVAGVLGKAGVLQHIGGILAGMNVETPGGRQLAEGLKPRTVVSAWREDVPGAVPTRLNQVVKRPVDAYVELRYDLDGEERVLRIAATQKVLVWRPGGQVGLQTYACANPELLRVPKHKDLQQQLEGHSEDPWPGAGNKSSERSATEAARGTESTAAKTPDAARQTVLKLTPGMRLVTATTGKDQPPVHTPLKSITAIGVQGRKDDKAEERIEGTKYKSFVPEAINLCLLRVEGLLLHVPTRFENTRGFVTDTAVLQPPQGLAPGQPLTLTKGMRLPAGNIRTIQGSFLTTGFPKKLWLADRAKRQRVPGSLRLVRIETARGTLLCGNKQLLVVARDGQAVNPDEKRIEVFAEEITHAPNRYQLLFIDGAGVPADGELALVPVTGAEYAYHAEPVALAGISGNGLAGVIEWRETAPDGKPVVTTIKQDIYFASGFMALTENEKSTRGGGSLTGGGGGKGRIAPEGKSVEEQQRRVTFRLPGLEAGSRQTIENRLLFTPEERAMFSAGFQRVQDTYAQATWGRVRNPERFRRFLSLYFHNAGPALEAAYAKADGKDGAPPWTGQAFREYTESRAFLLDQGNPADLYDWSFRYVFLVTLAYETKNTSWGDALMQDFLCITMTVALGVNPEQKDRSNYYEDPRWRLAEAIHWTRDVVALLRDNNTDVRAWVRPTGWDALFAANVQLLTEAGGASMLRRERDGHVEVELGNLWMQLHKVRHPDTAAAIPPGMDPELVVVTGDVHGRGAARLTSLIVAPSGKPEQAFEPAAFGNGPYAQRNIRQVLGIRVTHPERPVQ